MSNKYIEKAFLLFLAISVVLHVAVLTCLIVFYKADKKKEPAGEAYMVELSDLPKSSESPKADDTVKRLSERRHRVARQTAPRGDGPRDKVTGHRGRTEGPPYADAVRPITRKMGKAVPRRLPAGGGRPVPSGSLAQQPRALPELSKLYPSAEGISRLEDSYRKKYDAEVEQGDTVFLNTDDIQFGSFLRRFESAVYGVWRYPTAAARAGIQGVTPVKITFSKGGEIEKVQLLRSSGSAILDNEVLRALHAIGPLGGFPKAYTKEHFNLIAFFQYGLVQGIGSSRIH
jgi:protein TonB